MGHDVEPLGSPGRPVVQVGLPAPEVASASLRLDQVVVAVEVAQVVTVADVASALLAAAAAACSMAASSSGSPAAVHNRKPLRVPRACRSTWQSR
jgi:hypothetical protein